VGAGCWLPAPTRRYAGNRSRRPKALSLLYPNTSPLTRNHHSHSPNINRLYTSPHLLPPRDVSTVGHGVGDGGGRGLRGLTPSQLSRWGQTSPGLAGKLGWQDSPGPGNGPAGGNGGLQAKISAVWAPEGCIFTNQFAASGARAPHDFGGFPRGAYLPCVWLCHLVRCVC
jgi:hypothetical protein